MAKKTLPPDLEEVAHDAASLAIDVEYALKQAGKKDWKRVQHALLSLAEGITGLGKKLDKMAGVREPEKSPPDTPIEP